MTHNITEFPNNLSREELLYLIDVLQAMADGLADNTELSVSTSASVEAEHVVLLTIPECLELVEGLSRYTLTKLINQGKIKAFRKGEGKRGAYAVNKASLLDYFGYNA